MLSKNTIVKRSMVKALFNFGTLPLMIKNINRTSYKNIFCYKLIESIALEFNKINTVCCLYLCVGLLHSK